MSQYKCTLWPSGEVLELSGEDTLLNELKKAGKAIHSSCGGCATCSDCMVVVKSGESNLGPQTFEELRLLGNVFHITKERLSCQTKILGDITLDITHHSKSKEAPKSPVAKKTQTRLKKRDEVQKAARETEQKNLTRPEETWFRHWEKGEVDESKAKKIGGNKRPRAFNYTDSDEEENDK